MKGSPRIQEGPKPKESKAWSAKIHVFSSSWTEKYFTQEWWDEERKNVEKSERTESYERKREKIKKKVKGEEEKDVERKERDGERDRDREEEREIGRKREKRVELS